MATKTKVHKSAAPVESNRVVRGQRSWVVVEPAKGANDPEGKPWKWQVYRWANTPKQEWIGFFESGTTAVHWIMDQQQNAQSSYTMSLTKPTASQFYSEEPDGGERVRKYLPEEEPAAAPKRARPGARPPVAPKPAPKRQTAAEKALTASAAKTVAQNRADEQKEMEDKA